jgi:pimeloyl-ACP methyl ester carboxylesterase
MTLFVHQSGPSDAPAIVFLHGAGLSGRMWQPQFERLPEFHCLAPDLPEQGQSAGVGPFTLPDAAQRVANLIRQRAVSGRAHIVGLSLGGAVVVALLHSAPDVADHALISGTATRLGRGLATLNALNAPFLRLLKPDQVARLMMAQFRIPREYRDLLREDMGRFTPQAFAHVNHALTTIALPQAVKSPLLVAVGQKETWFAKQAARKLSTSIPGAKSVMVPGVGHIWNLEAPILFAKTVRAWVMDRPLPAELMPLSQGGESEEGGER